MLWLIEPLTYLHWTVLIMACWVTVFVALKLKNKQRGQIIGATAMTLVIFAFVGAVLDGHNGCPENGYPKTYEASVEQIVTEQTNPDGTTYYAVTSERVHCDTYQGETKGHYEREPQQD